MTCVHWTRCDVDTCLYPNASNGTGHWTQAVPKHKLYIVKMSNKLL